jgi:hypothetical protein
MARSRQAASVAGVVMITRRLQARSPKGIRVSSATTRRASSPREASVASMPIGVSTMSESGEGCAPLSMVAPRPSSRLRTRPGARRARPRRARRWAPAGRRLPAGGVGDHAAAVAVEAFAHLAPEQAGGQPLGADHRGLVAGLFVVLVIDGLHHRMRHIEPGEVEQLEGAELERLGHRVWTCSRRMRSMSA